MTRSTLRCSAALIVAATLLLPGMAVAKEIPSDRVEPVFSLSRLWKGFGQSLPDHWKAILDSAEGDNGWQLDPNGSFTQNGDNGWQIDPDG